MHIFNSQFADQQVPAQFNYRIQNRLLIAALDFDLICRLVIVIVPCILAALALRFSYSGLTPYFCCHNR